MRIFATVKVLMRDDPSKTAQIRPSRTSLSIGNSPSLKEGKILIVQSQQNRNGMKYRIEKNIDQVFAKFVGEGKVTIRFKVPAHDIVISGEPVEIRGFLKLLKNALDNKESTMPTVTARKSMNSLPAANLRLSFAGKGQFTSTTTLPLATKSLSITNVSLRNFDPRIVRLKFLQCLDLSCNLIGKLSEELSLLNLVELKLRGNHLGCTNDFSFMKPGALRNSLKLLDISKNQMEHIPFELTRFFELVTLKIDDNYLTNLPNSLGCLTKLRYFSASNNQLSVLPSSIVSLNLITLNICDNSFKAPVLTPMDPLVITNVPSLKDDAAKVIVKRRIPCVEGNVPLDVIYHVCSAFLCICRKAVFNSKCTFVSNYSLRNIASEFFYDSRNNHLIPTKFGVCSVQCYNKMVSQI